MDSNLENVIKGLEICKEESKLCFGECECGYQSYFPRCWITLAGDAFALLKAQEPLDVLQKETASTSGYVGYCPKCGTVLLQNVYNPKYCGVCGQAVKW